MVRRWPSRFVSLHSSLTALVAAFCLATPGIIHAGDGPRDRVASRIAIDNFARVDSTYYRGAEPNAEDYADLAALGIRTVIDLRSDDGNPHAKRLAEEFGTQYAAIPMTTHVRPSEGEIGPFLRTVSGARHQPVYVHCVGGRHHTGVMTAIYRMTKDQWDADQAFKEMKRYKYGADFLHPEFKRFVYGCVDLAAATRGGYAKPAGRRNAGRHRIRIGDPLCSRYCRPEVGA